MDLNSYYTTQNVWVQVEKEADALKSYAAFLNMFNQYLDAEDIATIREIMADEMNHAIRLEAMATKYSRLRPASDGLNEALSHLMVAA